MKTEGNDKLREMLAAEYALGTLRGGARRRFERWTRSDGALRALALQWSERLAPLADEIPSTVPPQRVWDAIEARLPGFASRLAARTSGPTGWWDRLGLWRGLSAAFATIAVVAIGIAVRPSPVQVPQIVRVEVPVAPSTVATLLDPKTSKPVAVVMASGQGLLSVKVLADVEIPAGKVLQLWMAPRDAEGLLSMGVLPGDPRQAVAEVATAGATTAGRAKAFGLSLEPSGGSPQPTHVLGLGAVIRVAGGA